MSGFCKSRHIHTITDLRKLRLSYGDILINTCILTLQLNWRWRISLKIFFSHFQSFNTWQYRRCTWSFPNVCMDKLVYQLPVRSLRAYLFSTRVVFRLHLMVQLALVKTLFVWYAIRALDGYHAFVTSLLMWCISSVPWVFNHTSAHDKSSCNSACAHQFLKFYTR